MQGDFTNLLIEHKENVTWQSILKNVPRNVMSFALRLGTNSLNSPDNLKRWGKRNMGGCPLCSCPYGTLHHIINICPVALKQGRFTWRHDSVLSHLTQTIKSIFSIFLIFSLPRLSVVMFGQVNIRQMEI